MNRTPLRRLVVRVAVGALALAAPVALTPAPASAAATDLFFSEYIEGSSFNKAVEVYNGTDASVDLAAGGYTVQVFSNGSATAGTTVALSGTVAAGDVYVLAQSSAGPAILAQADQTSGAGLWNGDDAVVLRRGSTVLDVIGRIGEDPGTEWGSGATSTADNTLRRRAGVCSGDADGSDPFDPAAQWDGFAQDSADDLGSHTASCAGPDAAPAVVKTTPADGGSATLQQSPTLTFSEAVALTGDAVSLSCTTSGAVATTVTGGPTEFTVDPAADLVDGESCTLTVAATGVSDVDAGDPPDTMAADVVVTFSVASACSAPATEISDIQGSGADAAVTGPVETMGVVVADYEGASPRLRGFYLQDLEGDGDPATSDAIFVFNGSNDSVSRGDLVRVSGTAGEFQGQTQISSVTGIDRCGTGAVEPTEVTLPVTSAADLERYEGMLVTLPQTLSVTEHYQLGRFGQVVLSSGGRLQQPTSVVAPGAAANALQARNDLNRLIVDDTLQSQNPDPVIWGRGGQPLSASNTLRGGDTVTDATGVLTYTWAGNSASGNAYRLRPLNQSGAGIAFEAANARPAGPPDVGGDARVVGLNLLNYFNTFDGLPDRVDNCTGGVTGPPVDCRGADDAAEFERQTRKTVAAITRLDADVIGVNEVENDGYGSDSALAYLVQRLNDVAGEGTYAMLDVDARTGQADALGSDAIKVGAIYRPAAVTPVGDTAVLNTDEFVTGGDGAPRNRPSLAQAWQVVGTGGVFVTDVNHLKSKGSACTVPDAGDGQGNCNAVRTASVRTLLQWLDTDPTGTGDEDVLLIGDYNSYAMEDPIRTLEEGGYTNLVREMVGPDAYSYVFNGQWGYLDHALGSASILGQVSGVADDHIDADEPSVLDYNTNFKTPQQVASLYAPDEFRVSDHDPVLIGVSPNPTLATGGLTGRLAVDGRVVRRGATLPVKVRFTAADGSVPSGLDPLVTVESGGRVVATGTMRLEDGEWVHLLRTAELPETGEAYEVTVHVPWNGQSVTGALRLR